MGSIYNMKGAHNEGLANFQIGLRTNAFIISRNSSTGKIEFIDKSSNTAINLAALDEMPSTDSFVVGPNSADIGNIALFDSTTGKLIRDSGLPYTYIHRHSNADALNTITSAMITTWNDKYTKSQTDSQISSAITNGITNKADKATTLAGYGITDAYTKTELDNKLTSAMHYKGTVKSLADLLATIASLVYKPETGDVWNITDAGSTDSYGVEINSGDNVIFNGTGWDCSSGIMDLSDYALADHTHNYAGSDSTGGAANTAKAITQVDTRSTTPTPSQYINSYSNGQAIYTEFKSGSSIGLSGTYYQVVTHTPWSDTAGGLPVQVAYNGNDNTIYTRYASSSSAWGSWYKIVTSAGGTMEGALVAQTNTNYTTAQMRNVILSTSTPTSSTGNNGDICIVYTA